MISATTVVFMKHEWVWDLNSASYGGAVMCIINKLHIECSKATAPQVLVISYGTCDTHGPILDACEFINIH